MTLTINRTSKNRTSTSLGRTYSFSSFCSLFLLFLLVISLRYHFRRNFQNLTNLFWILDCHKRHILAVLEYSGIFHFYRNKSLEMCEKLEKWAKKLKEFWKSRSLYSETRPEALLGTAKIGFSGRYSDFGWTNIRQKLCFIDNPGILRSYYLRSNEHK